MKQAIVTDYKPWSERTTEERRGRETPRLMLNVSQWNDWKRQGIYVDDCDIVQKIPKGES